MTHRSNLASGNSVLRQFRHLATPPWATTPPFCHSAQGVTSPQGLVEPPCSIKTLSAITNGSQPRWVWDQVKTCLFYQACKVHDIVCFGDQSANAEKSWHLNFRHFCVKLVCTAKRNRRLHYVICCVWVAAMEVQTCCLVLVTQRFSEKLSTIHELVVFMYSDGKWGQDWS